MSEQEQFLETVKQVLKPNNPSNLPPKGISAEEMSRKLKAFMETLEVKRQRVNEMTSGYIITRNPTFEEIEFIKEEITKMFNDLQRSFNK